MELDILEKQDVITQEEVANIKKQHADEVATYMAQLVRQGELIQDLQSRLVDLEAERDDLQVQLEEATLESGNSQLTATGNMLKQLRENEQANLATIADLRSQIEAFKNQVETLQNQNDQLTRTVASNSSNQLSIATSSPKPEAPAVPMQSPTSKASTPISHSQVKTEASQTPAVTTKPTFAYTIQTNISGSAINANNVKQLQQVAEISGYEGGLLALAISKDTRFLATGSRSGELVVWDTAAGTVVKSLKNENKAILSLKFSPDNKTLAVTGLDQHIRLFDISSWQPLRNIPLATPTFSLAYSPDSSCLAISSDKAARIIDLNSTKEVISLKGHQERVLTVAFNPAGNLLATGSSDGKLKIHHIATGKELLTFGDQKGEITALAFHQSGRAIASSSSDGTIKLWEVTTGRLIRCFAGHSEPVISICFSPDGNLLASSSHDKTVKIWNLRPLAGEITTLAGHIAQVHSVLCSPDNKSLISAGWDRTIKIWQVVDINGDN